MFPEAQVHATQLLPLAVTVLTFPPKSACLSQQRAVRRVVCCASEIVPI